MADCEYCHEDLDGYIRPIEKNGHAYLNTRCADSTELIITVGHIFRSCNINYCPMCGRKLDNG